MLTVSGMLYAENPPVPEFSRTWPAAVLPKGRVKASASGSYTPPASERMLLLEPTTVGRPTPSTARRIPPATLVWPLYVLEPVRVRIPGPSLTMPAVPLLLLMTPLIVAICVSEFTRNVRADPFKSIGFFNSMVLVADDALRIRLLRLNPGVEFQTRGVEPLPFPSPPMSTTTGLPAAEKPPLTEAVN